MSEPRYGWCSKITCCKFLYHSGDLDIYKCNQNVYLAVPPDLDYIESTNNKWNPDGKFYVVYCPTSALPITRQYSKIEVATKVRDSMVAKYPDSVFYIMESVCI